MKHTRESNFSLILVLLWLLGLSGLAINLMLLVRRLSDATATLAGCGAGSGCETVLGSRWSEVLGVPVSAPGFVIYLLLIFALTRPGRSLLAPLLGVICAAAIWFIAVQALIIQSFCPWCMAAHVVGLTLTLIGLPYAAHVAGTWKRALIPFALAAVLGGGGLIGLQILGPKPASHQVSDFTPTAEYPELMDDAHSRGEGRLAVFFDGRKGYRVEALPHLGRPDAPHVIVEYFDYTCLACRTMSEYLSALVAEYPDDICVVLLPVPLEHACNPVLGPLDAAKPGACDIARSALAVWRGNPENFLAFHEAVIADPKSQSAKVLAAKLVPDVDSAMVDPWVSTLIETNVVDWQVISSGKRQLPKLVLGKGRILHGFPPTEAEFIQVIAAELGLQ